MSELLVDEVRQSIEQDVSDSDNQGNLEAVPEHEALENLIPRLEQLFSRVRGAAQLLDRYNVEAEQVVKEICLIIGDGAQAFNRVPPPMKLEAIIDTLEPTGIQEDFDQFKDRLMSHAFYRFAHLVDSMQPRLWKLQISFKAAIAGWEKPPLEILKQSISVTRPKDRKAILDAIGQRESDAYLLLREFARVIIREFDRTQKELDTITERVDGKVESADDLYESLRSAFDEDPGKLDKKTFLRPLELLCRFALSKATPNYLRMRRELQNHLQGKHGSFRDFGQGDKPSHPLFLMQGSTPDLPSLRDNLRYFGPILHLDLRSRDRNMESDYEGEDEEEEEEGSTAAQGGEAGVDPMDGGNSNPAEQQLIREPRKRYPWIEGRLGRSFQSVVRGYLHVVGYYDIKWQDPKSQGRQFGRVIAHLQQQQNLGFSQQDRATFLRLLHNALKETHGDIGVSIRKKEASKHEYEDLWVNSSTSPILRNSNEVIEAVSTEYFHKAFLSIPSEIDGCIKPEAEDDREVMRVLPPFVPSAHEDDTSMSEQ
jgi:hypothetical protein